jgi:AcrR family transcriptional regulator
MTMIRSRRMKRAKKPAPPARTRRDPEAARALILGAAEHLIGARGPDAVGLKDVAGEAGVSHALVSHYFGTYTALVDAVLERRAEQLRNRVIALLGEPSVEMRPAMLLDRLWDVMAESTSARLTAWALLSGRADSAEFFPRRVQGMRAVADVLEARMRGRAASARGGAREASAAETSRADIEFLVTLSFVVTMGYGLGRTAVRASLGKNSGAAGNSEDEEFRSRVVALFELYLARPRTKERGARGSRSRKR